MFNKGVSFFRMILKSNFFKNVFSFWDFRFVGCLLGVLVCVFLLFYFNSGCVCSFGRIFYGVCVYGILDY